MLFCGKKVFIFLSNNTHSYYLSDGPHRTEEPLRTILK